MMQDEILLTDAEEVRRIWDKEHIKDLMSRRAYYRTADDRRGEITALWVSEEPYLSTASYGVNTGYYVGLNEIIRNYIVEHEQLRMRALQPFSEADAAIEYDEKNAGLGTLCIATINTTLVEIAGDGRSAKFTGYECGRHAMGKPEGEVDDYLTFGMVYADLVRQRDGQWKIWHLVQNHDISIPVGEDSAALPLRPDPATDPVAAEFGSPTLPQTVYDPLHGWEYIWYDMPRPYYSYDAVHSYGPGGNLGRRYFERRGERI